MLRYFIPVNDFPEGSEIIGAFVLVFQVIRMFPDVDAQDGGAFYFGYVHQWVVLVGGGGDLQFSVLYDQPCPAAAETGHTRGAELFLEGVEAAKGGMDLVGQLPGRSTRGFGAQDLPEEAVVPVTAGVITDGRADGACFLNQLFEGFALIRRAG